MARASDSVQLASLLTLPVEEQSRAPARPGPGIRPPTTPSRLSAPGRVRDFVCGAGSRVILALGMLDVKRGKKYI